MTTSEYTGPRPVAPPEPSEQPPESQLEPAVDRRRRGPRSLTTKLTVFVVALVVVVVTSIGAGTYFALRSFLDQKLDQQLQTTARGGAALFRQPGGDEDGPRPTSVFAVALDPSTGAALDYPSGRNIVSMQLTAEQSRELARRSTAAPVTVVTSNGIQLRVTARAGSYGNYSQSVPATILIGLSTDDERTTLHRLVLLELVIGGAAVLIATGATTYGVRFSLRRLKRVTTTAQEVATELSPTGAGLDRRVPDDEPDTEVGQLATSFNTMLAAVETQFAARLESEQRLRQFLADASHELRTPLTSIRGYAELARMQRAVGDDSSDNLDRIESEGTRMSRLVEDLLMLARGDAMTADDDESPAGVRESVDVPAMLDDVVSSSRAAYPDRPIELHVEAVADVIGDRDQLLRAIRNLVTNACVHTEAGRPITVSGFTQGGGVVITVVDGGPGLPPEQAAHVFERFWRADKARTRARGGTGLGMSIVATIVRAHGGSVRFESTVEGGSTVTLWLPAAL